jgi:hypothetical protein
LVLPARTRLAFFEKTMRDVAFGFAGFGGVTAGRVSKVRLAPLRPPATVVTGTPGSLMVAAVSAGT